MTAQAATLHVAPGSATPKALVTGATGTFGQTFLQHVLPLGWQVRAYSRDELKQHQLAKTLPGDVRWMLGDVRDKERLRRAAEGVDVIVHAAALKHVVSCEYNPFEAVKTNVNGTMNVIDAALDNGVQKAVFLSSDKAVHPVNIYGATKLAAEKCWLNSGVYGTTLFTCTRYGNVKGSRGSVLEEEGPVQLTDAEATRFWMTVEDAVLLVLLALSETRGADVFVPKLSSARVADLIEASGQPPIGLRAGEKLHESLISDEEVQRTWDCGSHYRICDYPIATASRVPPSFRYTSEVTAG